MFKALSRANREMQLENWTSVTLDIGTVLHIYDENAEDMSIPADDLRATSVAIFLEDWLRRHNKRGFALKREPASLNEVLHSRNDPCLTFLFKLSSEAVRFKLSWGGR